MSTLPRPELIFTWVGKPAPPMPVMPACFTISTISSVESLVKSGRGVKSRQGVSLKSFSMTTERDLPPPE